MNGTRSVVGGVGDGLRERRRAGAAALEASFTSARVRAVLEREPPHELDLLVRVAREAVDGDDRLQPEPGDDARDAGQGWRRRARSRRSPPSGVAAVVLERRAVATSTTALGRSPPARQTMLRNFSIPMSDAEPRLGDDEVAELQRDAVGDERVVAVRDVGERPAVDERRLALERLDEVRLERVLEQDGHRARGPQLLRR